MCAKVTLKIPTVMNNITMADDTTRFFMQRITFMVKQSKNISLAIIPGGLFFFLLFTK